jgi:hypothetical protein
VASTSRELGDPASIDPTCFNSVKFEFPIGEKGRGLVGHRSPAKGASQRGLRSEAKRHRRSGIGDP